jgi:hypothetical protein
MISYQPGGAALEGALAAGGLAAGTIAPEQAVSSMLAIQHNRPGFIRIVAP